VTIAATVTSVAQRLRVTASTELLLAAAALPVGPFPIDLIIMAEQIKTLAGRKSIFRVRGPTSSNVLCCNYRYCSFKSYTVLVRAESGAKSVRRSGWRLFFACGLDCAQ
jgi:hypothetical protein